VIAPMKGLAVRLLPYALAFFSSLCIMVLELVASRLVGRHVGMSLSVWTSVIGIILGGICLGNVLGGRLADLIEPRRAIGPLFALGMALTLATLWVNALVGLIPTPGSESPQFFWNLRTIAVVTLDFLVPATLLGMISPVVAKIAVEQSRKSGTAIGDVYFWGAIGSIVGTFVAGFWLIYMAPTSVIVTAVAGALALLTAAMSRSPLMRGLGLLAGIALGAGSLGFVTRDVPGVMAGPIPINGLALLGHLLAVVLAVLAVRELRSARVANEFGESEAVETAVGPKVRLGDLALLSFLISLTFMALEMVAGRLVQRHLGSSVYNWTSVIGVCLGGLSLGNYLGGKIADRCRDEKPASWLFLLASMLTLSILLLERWDVVDETLINLIRGEKMVLDPQQDHPDSVLSQAISMSGYAWWFRVLAMTTAVFFLPSLSMGTVSPLVVKLAVDRVRQSKRTGTAIGQVYAWGMVGSILGTFLTGFLLIDLLGTKGVILLLATVLALSGTALGSIPHAAWAGIPLGLCLISTLPLPALRNIPFVRLVKDRAGEPGTDLSINAHVDESNYYFIKVENEPYYPRGVDEDEETVDSSRPLKKRTLVLDNLIHGYFLLGHPEHIEYDYEFIYAQVSHRVASAKAKTREPGESNLPPLRTMFLGGGAYTFPRYLQHKYPGTTADVAEIDPAVTRANRIATGLLPEVPAYEKLEREPGGQPFLVVDGQTIRLGPTPWPTLEAFEEKGGEDAFRTAQNEAETEARASFEDFKRSSFPTVKTIFGDARQFVERYQGDVQYDLIFGDAFNDFSVPWHLTTREFNEKLARLLAPEGVYMINIIDVYKSDRKAIAEALADAEYAVVAEALRKAGAQADDIEAVARGVVNALDDDVLGVATWQIARAAAASVADVPGLSPPDPNRIAKALESVEEVLRGDVESMTATARDALDRAKVTGAEVDALAKVVVEAESQFAKDNPRLARIASKAVADGRRYGGFLSSWVKTARETFPHVYVFGTDESPGGGLRETFVVVVSRQPLDLDDLGRREDDPRFYLNSGAPFEPKPYAIEDLKALEIRSRGILLTDDYAPVENLLAPVAATRGDD
jgi:MFS family permease